MTGRRLLSILGVAVGLFSFFTPLVIVTNVSGSELRWSGYSVASQIVGFSSEHFWDIATALVYGSDSETGSKQSASSNATAAEQSTSGGALVSAFGFLISTAVAYCILLVLTIVIATRYSPRAVNRISTAGLLAAFVALVSFFIFADAAADHYGGAAETGVMKLDAGLGLYLLLASFAILFVVQRLAILDKMVAVPE